MSITVAIEFVDESNNHESFRFANGCITQLAVSKRLYIVPSK
jgi:hypothetical protein